MSEDAPKPGIDVDEDDPGRPGTGPRSSALDAVPRLEPFEHRVGSARVTTPQRPLAEVERRLGRTTVPSSALSPRLTAVFGGLFGVATVASIFALLIQVFPVKSDRAVKASSTSNSAAEGTSALGSASAVSERRGPMKRVRVELPEPWRVESLKPTHSVLKGEMERRSLTTALDKIHVPKDQVYRIIKAFESVYKFERPKKRDSFVIALERDTKRVVGFEYVVDATEIYQAKSNDAGLLEAKRLDMVVRSEEFPTAFYVGKDLARSYDSAGLDPGLTKAINDAFNGQTSTEAFEEGGVVRAILVETTALGRFVEYDRVKAIEYRPPDPQKPPTRAYWFDGAGVHSYVDDKGRHSSNAGWRSPVPGAPVTSHFNPKRLHPVLHTVMPHNGTDFGAPTGTPVYAAYRGKVTHVGPQGPSGNLVLIEHPNGIQTGYAHLSRFAKGIKAGDLVGTRQLVGYVGSTGRSTGPHLHFSAKRDGKFFDAMELKLDALQLLPPSERSAFDEHKARLDVLLEAIPLPDPPEPEEAVRPLDTRPSSTNAVDTDDAPLRSNGDAEPAAQQAKSREDGDKGNETDAGALLGDDLSGEIE